MKGFPCCGPGEMVLPAERGPEAIRGSARLQGGGGAQTPPAHRPGVGGLPHKLAFWLLSLTESATWWPQAAVQGLVPRSGPDVGKPSPPLPPAQSSATAGFISTWAMWAEPHTLAAQPPARRRRRLGPGSC